MFFCLFFCFQPILSSAVIPTTICMKCFYSDEALVVFILHVNSLGHLYTIVFLWKWKPPLLSLWRGWVRTKRVFNSIITFFFFLNLFFLQVRFEHFFSLPFTVFFWFYYTQNNVFVCWWVRHWGQQVHLQIMEHPFLRKVLKLWKKKMMVLMSVFFLCYHFLFYIFTLFNINNKGATQTSAKTSL